MFVFHRDILECNNCGIIYRSRQFWYGNPEVITGSIQMFVFHRDILECNNCGIIYRSRQFWYGNPEVVTGSIQMFVFTGIS